MKPVEITGQVHAITPEIPAGNSGKMKRVLVVRTDSQRSNLVPVECFGDKSDAIDDCKVGDTVRVKIYVGGREYNGKFYSDLQLASVEITGAKADDTPHAEQSDVDKDLPF